MAIQGQKNSVRCKIFDKRRSALNYSDAGQYTYAARNILGSSEATGNLFVRGKRIEYLTLSLIAYENIRFSSLFVAGDV